MLEFKPAGLFAKSRESILPSADSAAGWCSSYSPKGRQHNGAARLYAARQIRNAATQSAGGICSMTSINTTASKGSNAHEFASRISPDEGPTRNHPFGMSDAIDAQPPTTSNPAKQASAIPSITATNLAPAGVLALTISTTRCTCVVHNDPDAVGRKNQWSGSRWGNPLPPSSCWTCSTLHHHFRTSSTRFATPAHAFPRLRASTGRAAHTKLGRIFRRAGRPVASS